MSKEKSEQQKAKELRDVANIFATWDADAKAARYKSDRAGAERVIRHGLERAAKAVPLMNESEQSYSLRSYEPKSSHPAAGNALHYLREQHIGLHKEAISHHQDWLVRELMGEEGGFFKDYLALANECNRWADKLAATKRQRQARGEAKEKFASILQRNPSIDLTREEWADLCHTSADTISKLAAYQNLTRNKRKQ